MIKKFVVFGTILFLLFEVLYFQSNQDLKTVVNQEDTNEVYQLAFSSKREEFLKQYPEIILEEHDDTLIVLTNSKVLEEIQKNYPITIEK